MSKQKELQEPEDDLNDPLNRGPICEKFPPSSKLKPHIINEVHDKKTISGSRVRRWFFL